MSIRRRRFWICLLVVALCAALAAGGYLYWKNSRGPQNPMGIPMLLQTDYQAVICTIKGSPKSVMSSGCGATCAAIVGQYVTGRDDLGPEELFTLAYKRGDYFGDGLGHEAVSRLLLEFGLASRWTAADFEQVSESLRGGRPVIAHMGRGLFAEVSGHYIVLFGIDQDGMISVHDPYRTENGERLYGWDELEKELKNKRDSIMLIEPENASEV